MELGEKLIIAFALFIMYLGMFPYSVAYYLGL